MRTLIGLPPEIIDDITRRELTVGGTAADLLIAASCGLSDIDIAADAGAQVLPTDEADFVDGEAAMTRARVRHDATAIGELVPEGAMPCHH